MFHHKLTMEPGTCAPGFLITPRSHLTDQHLPECEIVALPARQFGGGEFELEIKEAVKPTPALPRRHKVKEKLGIKLPVLSLEGTIIDLRLRSPQNWAHFLNNHLPISFGICDMADLPWSDVTLILPENTPCYVREATKMFGMNTVCTDRPVSGKCAFFNSTPWTGLRAKRGDWAKLPPVRAALKAGGIQGADDYEDVPSKVFISRRGTRMIENAEPMETYLEKRGFKKLYLEDLDVRDQFRIFEAASQIVAIHGAGLAPLLYRGGSNGRGQLIELLPCGIMTDVFRVIAGLVECDWIGVRGKMKASYVEALYDLDTPFLSAANDDFEVDIDALDLAFEKLG